MDSGKHCLLINSVVQYVCFKINAVDIAINVSIEKIRKKLMMS